MTSANFFYTHPIFRFDEFVNWRENQGIKSSRAAVMQLILHYLKSGQIIRIRRELYAVVPPNVSAANFQADPYLITAKVADDSIIGYHSALTLHGLAYSVMRQFNFISSKKIKSFELNGQMFLCAAVPTGLKTSGQAAFGLDVVDRQGINIRITNIARTFVDVIDRPDLCGGWEEVYRSIDNIAVLDSSMVLEYALLLDKAILAAKIGYFLEQRQGPFAVSEKILQALEKQKPVSPQYLVKNTSEKTKLIKRWNLLIPTSILNKNWEEPTYDI